MQTNLSTDYAYDRGIVLWLYICAATVFGMVLLGGVTRLTHSGLSMVDWRPLMGVIPPLTEQAWLATFEQYKQYPEYQKVNFGMDLAGFKSIFWFEYAHRVLGRLIGVMFAVPLIYFWIRGRLRQPLTGKLVVLFVLGGLQGLMGWYMVQSGLVDDPNVSQYRLTAHLGLAVIIFLAMLWVAWDERFGPGQQHADRFALALAGLVFLTMMSGGFVAGTRAGLLFGTWPLMGDRFFPAGLLAGGLRSVFEDPITIQFNHRMLAYITTIVGGLFIYRAWRTSAVDRWVWIVAALLLLQVTLGIATLVLRVPVPLAAAHQGVGLLLLGSAWFAAHRGRYSAAPS